MRGSLVWKYLSEVRHLPASVLQAGRAADILREGPYGSAWFAHHDASRRVTHVEIRGPGYRGALKDGAKILFRLPSNRDPGAFVLGGADRRAEPRRDRGNADRHTLFVVRRRNGARNYRCEGTTSSPKWPHSRHDFPQPRRCQSRRRAHFRATKTSLLAPASLLSASLLQAKRATGKKSLNTKPAKDEIRTFPVSPNSSRSPWKSSAAVPRASAGTTSQSSIATTLCRAATRKR